ncbi:acetamidase/formamidase family protein [Bradyrhizobium prioriisuperbiae]|uniref:acetamidase/formamidase family protein n=1 Tax=Bradyrhizobium prioriisuperbiae TaxID=2854389 RepID=UPI0028EB1110|nr:acetamidase/formamidase family protein [Bradyrhizobium prioritasuperba]
MSIRPFTSESYSEDDGGAAWQDVLRAFGLQTAPLSPMHDRHVTALSRAASDTIGLMRFAAGPQTLSPLQQRSDLPVLLLPAEGGAVLKTEGAAQQLISAGHLVVLPRHGTWRLTLQRDMRAVVLAVTAEAFGGRKIGVPESGDARIVAPDGLAGVLSRTLEATSATLETLTPDAWTTIGLGLAEMLLALLRQTNGPDTGAQASLFHRICGTIERKLDDPDISLARIAQIEGISERYLQKLFESTGDNFTHYLRERRLQRCWADLSNPADAHRSVSEIAFRCGFSDAAHFSRSFRERFGLSPRAFRQHEAERAAGSGMAAGQRGWPQDALAQLRPHKAAPVIGSIGPAPGPAPRHGGRPAHHHLPVDAERVHWGFFSRSLKPLIEIYSGDTITVETLTQHASDDPERMIVGDPGAESVFRWTREEKAVDRRGAGPLDASIYGRGAGEGFGVHICTGPIAVKGAEPGDVLEVRILDIVPRRSRNPDYADRVFGSSVAAWWGYHYGEFLSEPMPREAVTIYEIITDTGEPHARALYSYRWQPQTDPFGVVHQTYDYPGVPVAAETVRRRHAVLDGIRIPLRPHFGVIGVAPREADLIDSVPPAYFGGNLDNWRLGKGSAVYLPVSVPEALLSIGDPHAAQGDGELSGTAIECSMTGTFQVVLHKKADLAGRPFADLTYPLIETETDWVLTGFSHPNYLAEFGAKGQSEVYAKSSLDLAMKDAFRKVRRFLMTTRGLSEDEAIALISAAVDFGVTQVVDGNWGVHAILSKRLFAYAPPSPS